MMTTTTEMSPALREALIAKGWNPDNVCWGRRVSGSPHGMTLERDGVERYHSGPFVPIHADGQSAIVRWS
jgi:hypothetical protein